MRWTVEYTNRAKKSLKKMDRRVAEQILDFMDNLEDPRSKGKALVGNLHNIWRYRVGNYRILTRHENDHLIVLVVDVGHRKDIYR